MRRILFRTCFGLVLTRVDSCWLVPDSCWLVLDSYWLVSDLYSLVLDPCWFVLIRVDSCWFVLTRVDLCWYSCIKIDLISKSISWTFIGSLCNETIIKYAFHEMLWKKYFTVYPRLKINIYSNYSLTLPTARNFIFSIHQPTVFL